MKKITVNTPKLTLHKETLRNLSPESLDRVQGGITIVTNNAICRNQTENRACLSTNFTNTHTGLPC